MESEEVEAIVLDAFGASCGQCGGGVCMTWAASAYSLMMTRLTAVKVVAVREPLAWLLQWRLGSCCWSAFCGVVSVDFDRADKLQWVGVVMCIVPILGPGTARADGFGAFGASVGAVGCGACGAFPATSSRIAGGALLGQFGFGIGGSSVLSFGRYWMEVARPLAGAPGHRFMVSRCTTNPSAVVAVGVGCSSDSVSISMAFTTGGGVLHFCG